jgi:interferon-induced GTP-binding protein Mx1
VYVVAQNVLVGPSNSVCEKLITLEVESPGIPNLTLIDLPGIARVAMDDQPDNLPEQVAYATFHTHS